MKKNILIIDDNPTKAERIKTTLQSIYKDTRFSIQSNYNAAIDFINRNYNYNLTNDDDKTKISFIVLDWMFPRYPGGPVNPEMGEEVIQEIFERDMDIPVIICSSNEIRLNEEDVIGEIVYDESSDLKTKFVEILGQENIDRDNEEESVVKKI